MKKFFKSGWFKFLIFMIVFIFISLLFYFKKEKPVSYRTATVTIGNIESFIEGSGTISSSESRKILSKVSSEVVEVLHDEGEFVNTGDVIARLDSSTFESNLESQRIAIEQARLSANNIKKQISDLNIIANESGYISGLTISEGSYVNNTMEICKIVESNVYEIVLPFTYLESNLVQVGNSAKVTVIQNFAELEGVVTKVSNMRKLANASSQVVDVTIKVATSGYSLAGASARAEVLVNGTKQLSTSTGIFSTIQKNVVRAKSTGTVKLVNAYEGKFVNAGDVIAVLSNDDLAISLQNANLTLNNLNSQYNAVKDQYDNYTIKAPMSGTITAQTLNVGDMVSAGTIISTISNKDILEFKIPVDELDIAKISYDDEVRVSIDAISETKTNPIEGKIFKLPLEGVSTAGITEYYVTVQIPGNDDIRISMSANAKIITSSKKNVIMVPIDAIAKENGISYVDVVADDGILEKREIETGDRNISYVEVKAGLHEGEKIVIPEASSGFFNSNGRK